MSIAERVIGGHGLARMTAIQAVALAPPLFLVWFERGAPAVALFLTALVIALLWEATFAMVRRRAITIHGVTTAMIVGMLCPADTALWQLALAVSLGVVVGELINGGRGFSFVNAAGVSLALLVFSFPGLSVPDVSMPVALAALPGGVVLLVLGLVSVRLCVAAVAVTLLVSAAEATVLLAAMSVMLFFVAADPFAAAQTGSGKLEQGALFGGLTVLFAALMGSVLAPLLDQIAILVRAQMRRRNHV